MTFGAGPFRNPPMPLLQDTLQTFKARLKELQPAVDEHRELSELVSRLENSRPTTARRRTPKQRGGTMQAVQKAVAKQPGMTTTEVGKAIGRAPHYLYRVLPELEKRGVVRRDKDKRWHPAGS